MGTGYARWKLLDNTFVAQIVQCTSCNPLQLFVDEYISGTIFYALWCNINAVPGKAQHFANA